MAATVYTTADGSHSLRSKRFGGASYHSHHGSIQESRHIFIEAGLLPLLPGEGMAAGDEVTVLEMGFGGGLNALLTRLLAREYPETLFRYQTYEAFPVGLEEVRQLNYPALLGVDAARLVELHGAQWSVSHRLDENFIFEKHREDFLMATLGRATVDVIYYDAFAPDVQPELWSSEAMAKCYGSLRRPGGRLVTYCARGQFKRDLRTVGFHVEALPGPVGKREITRALVGTP